LSPAKTTLTFVVAGVVGLALILLLLLEISVRMELAKEASETAMEAIPAPSGSFLRLIRSAGAWLGCPGLE
jgi:hypothetical protein